MNNYLAEQTLFENVDYGDVSDVSPYKKIQEPDFDGFDEEASARAELSMNIAFNESIATNGKAWFDLVAEYIKSELGEDSIMKDVNFYDEKIAKEYFEIISELD